MSEFFILIFNANPIPGLSLNLGTNMNLGWQCATLTRGLADLRNPLAVVLDNLELQKERSRKSQSDNKSKIF